MHPEWSSRISLRSTALYSVSHVSFRSFHYYRSVSISARVGLGPVSRTIINKKIVRWVASCAICDLSLQKLSFERGSVDLLAVPDEYDIVNINYYPAYRGSYTYKHRIIAPETSRDGWTDGRRWHGTPSGIACWSSIWFRMYIIIYTCRK